MRPANLDHNARQTVDLKKGFTPLVANVGQALAGRTSQFVKGPKTNNIDLGYTNNNTNNAVAVSESTEMQIVDAITESNQLAESGRSGNPDLVIDDASDASSMMDV